MSNYESEWGTIKVPTVDFARIRKEFEREARRRQEWAFEQTQTFWKGLTRKQQTDRGEYEKARYKFRDELAKEGSQTYRHGSYFADTGAARTSDAFGTTVYGPDASDKASLVEDMLYRADFEEQQVTSTNLRGEQVTMVHRSRAAKPRRVQKTDVNWATNRTTHFQSPEGGSVSFDRDNSSIVWEVQDNNHAVEWAHERWTWKMLNSELAKVRWSRGTGGVLYYRSEYDSEFEGEHDNTVDGFGPIGQEQAPSHARDYVDTKGKLHSAAAARDAHYKAQAAAAQAYQRAMARAKTTPASTAGSFAPKPQAVSSAQFPGHPLRP